MAVRNTSIVPFKVNNIPDRYTPVGVTDQTVVTTTAGTTAWKRLNRLQSASFGLATGVVDITEMGAQYRPGLIDDLGEVRWSLSWNAVGITNLASLTNTTVPTTPGASVTISASSINASTQDFSRLVADSTGAIFGTLYMQDCIMLDYRVEAAEGGMVMETAAGSGPSAVFFPGYVLPKVYVATATDVTNGYLSPASILGADESIVQIFQPGVGTPPSFYQQNGANYFLKLEKVPGGVLTNSPIRYFENAYATAQTAISIGSSAFVTPSNLTQNALQVGQVVTAGLGTANVENVTILQMASQVNTNSGSSTAIAGANTITPASMLGIQLGVTLQVVNPDGSNAETIIVTTATATTFTATFATTKVAGFLITSKSPSFRASFTKTHAVGDSITGQLTVAQAGSGQATYNPTTQRIYLGDSFVAGDVFRLVILSYNSDSTQIPTTIPINSPDTVDRAAVSTRITPFKINGLNVSRLQRASMAVTLRRDHVQGLGENAIAYGISSIPDVAVDMDIKETDLAVLSQLSTGSKNLSSAGGTIQNDFQDLNYITRKQLQLAIPSGINLYDPFDASKIICAWSVPQVVVTDITYASTAKGDNSIRLTCRDAIGNMTVTATNPL